MNSFSRCPSTEWDILSDSNGNVSGALGGVKKKETWYVKASAISLAGEAHAQELNLAYFIV